MKIYNEVISRFNEQTGLWETISEDSFDYDGPMALAQGIPPNASSINTSDTISDTIKTTAGYFTNGDGTIGGGDISTGSLTTSNSKYYFNVLNGLPTVTTSEVQFACTFGHAEGTGSDTVGDSGTNRNTLKGATQAIYNQLANLLLEETEASGGFKIAVSGDYLGNNGQQTIALSDNISAGQKDPYIYALVGKRARFKDRFNKKSWTMTLSGSLSNKATAKKLHLTDDSATQPAVATPGGPRYNIVSGTLGNAVSASSARCFGWFYPEMGIMVFSGMQLSSSLPGGDVVADVADLNAVEYMSGSQMGFGIDRTQGSRNDNNALRLVNCLKGAKIDGSGNTHTTALRIRSEEDQTQENYFCRIKAEEYNFSANPTFVSGSKNKIRNADMHGNPQTFITGVGLYNSSGQLLAIAKLSSPLKKNFASEATIKVKLTY